MRTIFFGSPDFAVPCLEAVHDISEIAVVISQPDRPAGRGLAMRPPAVKKRALELGLINHAVDRDSLDAEVSSVLDDVLRGGPLALAAAKRLVYEVPAMEQSEAFAHTAEISGQLFASDEAAAGMKAFLERTDAPWITDEN